MSHIRRIQAANTKAEVMKEVWDFMESICLRISRTDTPGLDEIEANAYDVLDNPMPIPQHLQQQNIESMNQLLQVVIAARFRLVSLNRPIAFIPADQAGTLIFKTDTQLSRFHMDRITEKLSKALDNPNIRIVVIGQGIMLERFEVEEHYPEPDF